MYGNLFRIQLDSELILNQGDQTHENNLSHRKTYHQLHRASDGRRTGTGNDTEVHSRHAGLVSLLHYFVAAENGMDNNLGVAADLSGPMNEPFAVPLDILLVFWRHMLLDRAVLVEPSVQYEVGADPISAVEDLHRGSGEPHIHLLLDVFKGNRIVHTFHRDVVIGSYRCPLPGCQF